MPHESHWLSVSRQAETGLKFSKACPISKKMNSPNTKYFFFLAGTGVPTERFDTDDYGQAKKAIVDFVRTHKDRKGTIYTKDKGGSEWYDYAGWHFD